MIRLRFISPLQLPSCFVHAGSLSQKKKRLWKSPPVIGSAFISDDRILKSNTAQWAVLNPKSEAPVSFRGCRQCFWSRLVKQMIHHFATRTATTTSGRNSGEINVQPNILGITFISNSVKHTQKKLHNVHRGADQKQENTTHKPQLLPPTGLRPPQQCPALSVSVWTRISRSCKCERKEGSLSPIAAS